jgi:pyruvate formate lyase activating enzyme
MSSPEATIFDIQKYTVHDGPGIRTTLFFKGCPMHCYWCSNPESINPRPEVGVYAAGCIGVDKCGRCLHACPYQEESILLVTDGKITGIDRSKCRYCLCCAKACPNSTLRVFGKKYTVREAFKIIMDDCSYYMQSAGGVTINGGDPMLQWEFVRDLLAECKRYGIHTCLETELLCGRDPLVAVMPYVDLLITDIKHMDSTKHREHTGAPNEMILDNIRYVVRTCVPTIIRTPIIPDFNDDDANIHAISRFVSEQLKNNIRQYQILSFRHLGEEKYAALGRDYAMKDVNPVLEEYEPKLRRFASILCTYGVPAVAGSNVKYDHTAK